LGAIENIWHGNVVMKLIDFAVSYLACNFLYLLDIPDDKAVGSDWVTASKTKKVLSLEYVN